MWMVLEQNSIKNSTKKDGLKNYDFDVCVTFFVGAERAYL